MTKWGEKPYHSLDYMLRERFGEKVYKVTLNGGMSCPNRDGKIGTRGCIFCSAGGSGDFAADAALSITDQIMYYQPPDEQCARNGYDTLLEHEITAAVTACKTKDSSMASRTASDTR